MYPTSVEEKNYDIRITLPKYHYRVIQLYHLNNDCSVTEAIMKAIRLLTEEEYHDHPKWGAVEKRLLEETTI